MARIKIEGIVEHLDFDLRRALADAVKEVLPNGIHVDKYSLFRAFMKRPDFLGDLLT